MTPSRKKARTCLRIVVRVVYRVVIRAGVGVWGSEFLFGFGLDLDSGL